MTKSTLRRFCGRSREIERGLEDRIVHHTRRLFDRLHVRRAFDGRLVVDRRTGSQRAAGDRNARYFLRALFARRTLMVRIMASALVKSCSLWTVLPKV